MIISAGTRLGPYEVVDPIGAGGMGEVWRARDTRLDRSVAIKLLPAEFASNAPLRLRFEREAKIISQLNDPRICTLYDVGHENGRDYLVLEYLEGETLADRISRGPLPLQDVLKYGAEIAEGLAKAHRACIVHRDLKPGNVMITKSGAKLLDFGLAKNDLSLLGPQSSVMATQQKPLTSEGTILGTFQYMAPEQLDGNEADARTDIFALGTTLYEMATGRRAFDGKTKTSLIAAIVAAEPRPISEIQPLTPPAFEHVVTKCLAKDPDERWQSAYDIAEELRWIGATRSTTATAAGDPRSVLPRQLGWIAAIILAAIAGWVVARQRLRTPPREVTRFTLPAVVNLGGLVVSPNGRSIAYVGTRDGTRALWMQSFAEEEPRYLIEAGIISSVFWSPDSRKIGFLTGAQLKWIAAAGGSVETICDTTADWGAWGRKGIILLGGRDGATLRVSEGGGAPVEVLPASPSTLGQHAQAAFLPDGEHFLFFRKTSATAEPGAVYVATIDGKEIRRLFSVGERPSLMYAEPGFITYTAGEKLLARRFDMRTLSVSGDPLLLLEGLGSFMGRARVSVGESGTIVYRKPGHPGSRQLVLLSRDGRELRAIGKAAAISHLVPSHDERTIALEIIDGKRETSDVWVTNVESGVSSRITFTPKFEWQMTWMPDGSRLIFASNQTDNSDLFSIPARGGSFSRLFTRAMLQTPLDVSPDGKYLLYMDNSAGPKYDLAALPLGGGEPIIVSASEFEERSGRFSPDGQWIAFDSNESGEEQVYVQRFPTAGGKIQVSSDGGFSPSWRRDGRELYYLTRDFFLVAVPVDRRGAELYFGPPRRLFQLDLRTRPSFGRYLYAPSRNGTFYVAKKVSDPVENAINVIINATSLLEEHR
jgi:Tol biopolymer transport system component